MTEKKQRSPLVFWIASILTLGLTGLFAVADLHEYYVVAIKKDIAGYPFGHEGPTANYEYYKTADLYASHVLTFGLLSTVLFALALLFIIKRKTLGQLTILALLVAYMAFNVWTA
jgi:hypothetical protein